MPAPDDPFPDDLFLVEPDFDARPHSYLDPPSAGLLAAEWADPEAAARRSVLPGR